MQKYQSLYVVPTHLFFHVTGIDLAGGRYVVYEELFPDGVSIAEHKDFYDENQTFYVPKLVTSAYDINTGTNIAKNDTKSTIIDEVQISGLKEGQNYYLSSVLMDKETESQFINGGGKIKAVDMCRMRFLTAAGKLRLWICAF